GKVAVVTGASKGIGAEIAKQFAAEGITGVIIYVSGGLPWGQCKFHRGTRRFVMNSPNDIQSSESTNLGGSFTFPRTSMTVRRMGYGAMQLAGPGVWGPPRDPDAAVAVLREAVAAGVNHIDTSDFYGPHVTNQIIRRALHPYPKELVIVTKVGARRGADKSWIHDASGQNLTDSVHDNLRNLKVDTLDVVNFR